MLKLNKPVDNKLMLETIDIEFVSQYVHQHWGYYQNWNLWRLE